MDHDNGRSGGRSRSLITLTQTYREKEAREVLGLAFKAAEIIELKGRIEMASGREKNFAYVEGFSNFAEKLRLEVAVAVATNNLHQFELDLPDADYLVASIEALKLFPIPRLSLWMEPTESGFRTKLVGEAFVRKVL